MKITHETLIKLMQLFGYNRNNDGVCNGYTWMWIQAQLLGPRGAKRFYDRLKVIELYQNDLNKLKELIDRIKKQIRDNAGHPEIQQKIYITYQDILEIPVLCEGIELYHSPELHEGFYVASSDKTPPGESTQNPKTHHQQDNLQLLAPTVASYELELISKPSNTVSSISSIKNDCFILTPEATTDYFRDLEKWLVDNKSAFGQQIIVPIKLGTDNHAVACSYNLNTNSWQFLDINDDDDDDEYVRNLENISMLTQCLMDSFDDKSVLLFRAMPVIINPNHLSEQAVDQLKKINKKHQALTKEQAELTNSRQASLQYLASKFGDVELMGELVELGANVNAAKTNGSSPLCIACQNKEYKVVELLVSHGATINHAKINGDTPLHIAVLAGDLNIVSLLLINKAQVNSVTTIGLTPLITALIMKDIEIVVLLLENGADPNLTPPGKLSPLEYALQSGDVRLVQLLITNGAKLDVKSDKGLTPLISAIYNGNLELVSALLNGGADPGRADCDGITPIYWACMLGNDAVLELLLSRSNETINTVCDSGHTPLLVACLSEYTRNNTKLFQLLLRNGADVRVTNNAEETAFDIALQNKNVAAVKCLLSYFSEHQINYSEMMSKKLRENQEIVDFLAQTIAQVKIVRATINSSLFNYSGAVQIKESGFVFADKNLHN